MQPQKKSINFGIFKHPGTKNGLTPVLPDHDTLEQPPTPIAPVGGLDALPADGKRAHRASVSKHDSTALVEKLQGIGLKSMAWTGRCEADQVSMGRYDVAEGEGGMYGLVFDNTFSKTTGKTVTFVLMTHPTNAPPKSGHHLHYSQAFAANSTSNLGKSYTPSLQPVADSQESLHSDPALHRGVLEDPRPKSKGGKAIESQGLEGSTFYTGVLQKKRRKKAQGWARRFFSLDFTSSTLSYYRNRHSSALRGAVPLSLAAIGVNEKTREFSVDSGAEVWHLKAGNRRDFDGWREALERASASATTIITAPATPAKSLQSSSRPNQGNPVEQYEWARVEQLVSKVAGSRDAVRNLAKDTDPKYGVGLGLTHSNSSSNAPSPIMNNDSYFPEGEDGSQGRKPFWKRKTSAERSTTALLRRSVSAQLAVPSPSSLSMSPAAGNLNVPKRPRAPSQQTMLADEDVHERCMALLRDLDSVVADFSALVAESKARRMPPMPTSTSRMSLESTRSEEFFDAPDGTQTPSQLLNIRRSSEFEDRATDTHTDDHVTDADSDTSSDAGDAAGDQSELYPTTSKSAQAALFPSKPKSVQPLPLPPTKRRTTVTPPKQAPPSIIGFLRKNAGKDLSTVSMPVTANEPTSLLQRLAESIEYPGLLDSAASASLQPAERLMYVAAFAIAGFSNNRVKERAIRKPFNPMLGETFELVREDLGFRFVSEKVSHHPVRMACQADSLANGGWSFSQGPQPVQKFWGKSVELNTEGRARVALHAPGEYYSWSQATAFLRNVIAGEKYVEPVQSMTVVCETSGMRAVATFKAGGMFSGRSEEVTTQLFDPKTSGDTPLPLGLTGKWTESLKRTDTGAVIWTAGPLVPDSGKVYGFTSFAATLNEITENEDGFLPPTDSRLRPDQRALEHGDVDKAEATKARLEERQRARRKVLESHGQQWQPRFFEKVAEGDEETWRLKEKGGYWERRVKGDWSGVGDVFET